MYLSPPAFLEVSGLQTLPSSSSSDLSGLTLLPFFANGLVLFVVWMREGPKRFLWSRFHNISGFNVLILFHGEETHRTPTVAPTDQGVQHEHREVVELLFMYNIGCFDVDNSALPTE